MKKSPIPRLTPEDARERLHKATQQLCAAFMDYKAHFDTSRMTGVKLEEEAVLTLGETQFTLGYEVVVKLTSISEVDATPHEAAEEEGA